MAVGSSHGHFMNLLPHRRLPDWLSSMQTHDVALVAVVGAALLVVRSHLRHRKQVTARLTAMDRKLDTVMAHLKVAELPPEEPDVVRHLERGEIITAIRIYRERTGLRRVSLPG